MRFLTTLVLTAAFGVAAVAGDPDPILGIWKLDILKSHFSPGPAPQSQTRVYATTADGMIVTTTTVDAAGRSSKTAFPAKYDGKVYSVTGIDQANAMALKRVDERTAEITLQHADKVIAKAERIVSGDGKTMTITYEESEADPPVKNVSVYQKQ
jgi:hypothetical protein